MSLPIVLFFMLGIQDCPNASVGPLECAAAQFDKANSELQKVYEESLKVVKEEDAVRLRKAQTMWQDYATADCAAERSLLSGGTIAPTAEFACKTEHALERTKLLRQRYLDRYGPR
jgi:uncharacterized protein YecT (DUF1311 family)